MFEFFATSTRAGCVSADFLLLPFKCFRFASILTYRFGSGSRSRRGLTPTLIRTHSAGICSSLMCLFQCTSVLKNQRSFGEIGCYLFVDLINSTARKGRKPPFYRPPAGLSAQTKRIVHYPLAHPLTLGVPSMSSRSKPASTTFSISLMIELPPESTAVFKFAEMDNGRLLPSVNGNAIRLYLWPSFS